MTDDRLFIAQAVLDGIIGSEHLTDAEVDEIELMVSDAVFDKLMDDAADRGCTVFSGFEEETLH